MKHTPTPWVLDRHSVIRGGPFRQYVKGQAQDQLAMFTGSNNMDPEEVTANAEFVVRAVNTHDGMVRLLLALRACTPTNDWEQELCDVYDAAEPVLREAGVLP